LRSLLSLCGALLVLLTFTAGIGARPAEGRANAKSVERKVIRLVNRLRVHNGVPRLLASRRLSRAARSHSADVMRRGLLDHASSDGTAMFDRVRRYFPARCAGETLAAVHGSQAVAGTVVRLWMASPAHRAIMLDGSFRRVGVGQRRGSFGGGTATLVTADFAAR
jgi:uncharacterized protein YkwD